MGETLIEFAEFVEIKQICLQKNRHLVKVCVLLFVNYFSINNDSEYNDDVKVKNINKLGCC